jgi:hypothetical protein
VSPAASRQPARPETAADARPPQSNKEVQAGLIVKLRSSISPTRDQYLAYVANCWITVPSANDATVFADRLASDHAVHRARRYLRIREYEIDRR